MVTLRRKRVLVTGAAGFIGANLVKEVLRHGAQVHAVVRATTSLWRIENDIPSLTLHVVDLADGARLRAVVAAAQPQVIFHLAAPGGHQATPDARAAFLASTVLGTSNLLEALAPVEYERMVVTGSSLEYGPSAGPHRESDRLRPTTFRGAGKAAATLLCLEHAHAERRPIVVLRLFSVYGPWEGPSRLIPTAIRAALCGEEMPLTAPGVRHDFVFVHDVVEAMLTAAGADGVDGEVINIGSARQWANEDVVDAVQRLTGETVRVRPGDYPAKSADTAHWVADIGKAAAMLGWQPAHDLTNGLRETIEWNRARLSLADRITTAPR